MKTRTLAFALAVLSLCGLVLEGCTLPTVPDLEMEGGGAGGNVRDAANADRADAPGLRTDSSVSSRDGGADGKVPPADASIDGEVHRQTPPSTTHLRWTPETAPCKTAPR